MVVENSQKLLALPPRPRWLDRQGFSTLFAGTLLLLISFTTNYGDDNLLHLGSIPAAHQIGMGLHLAALATFNWRPIYDIEQETERLRIKSLKSEKRLRQLKNEVGQLNQENKRLAALESRMDALLLSADSSSQTPPSTGSN